MSQQPGGCLDTHEAEWFILGIYYLKFLTPVGLTNHDGVVRLTPLDDVSNFAL